MKTYRLPRRLDYLLTLVPAILLAGALFAPRPMAAAAASVNNPFVVLLDGTYQPVAHAENRGLTQVNLNDGTYSEVPIFGVSGIPGTGKDEAIGTFYVRLDSSLAPTVAYHVRGGSFSAMFVGNDVEYVLDANGLGISIIGTYELEILEATGRFRPFEHGHIHMVDNLHVSFIDGALTEHCFCHVSR